jgi:hypothetical protein
MGTLEGNSLGLNDRFEFIRRVDWIFGHDNADEVPERPQKVLRSNSAKLDVTHVLVHLIYRLCPNPRLLASRFG